MGYLTAGGSLARVTGPVVVSYVYQRVGTYPTIAVMVASLLVSLVLTFLTYSRMGSSTNVNNNRQSEDSQEEEATDLWLCSLK